MTPPTWLFPATPTEPDGIGRDEPDGSGRAEPDGSGRATRAGRGPDGNARLTATTGILMVTLLAVEAVTLLGVRQMLTLHIFVGIMLAGPAVLKIGSTLYRFTRYYTGAPTYHRAGPPPLLLRVLGPVLVLATVGVIATGVTLIFTGDHRDDGWLTLHQTFFWIFVIVLGVHLVGHLWQAITAGQAELRDHLRGPAARNRHWRLGLLTVSLIVGVAAAILLLPHAAAWTNRPDVGGEHYGTPPSRTPASSHR